MVHSCARSRGIREVILRATLLGVSSVEAPRFFGVGFIVGDGES
jgi:hypothetical protein